MSVFFYKEDIIWITNVFFQKLYSCYMSSFPFSTFLCPAETSAEPVDSMDLQDCYDFRLATETPLYL